VAIDLVRRGDIYLIDFAPARQGEANYVHPAVIVTNNRANAISPLLVVIPVTSNLERVYPFELFLPNQRTSLNKDSKAQVNLIRHVSVTRMARRLGFVPEDLMIELDRRIREHLAL
jgi:mRNA interferase MazF